MEHIFLRLLLLHPFLRQITVPKQPVTVAVEVAEEQAIVLCAKEKDGIYIKVKSMTVPYATVQAVVAFVMEKVIAINRKIN